jgi:leucine dehydrogenase
VNDQSIRRLRCGAIAGAANNQLWEPRHGDVLQKRGILYAPDFVINAGGIISIGLEREPRGYSSDDAMARIQNIPHALREIYALATSQEVSTHAAAERLAENLLRAAEARGQRLWQRSSSIPPSD